MGAERTSRESERRLVSVLFADISGFTAMSEKMDPEEVSSIINRCFHTLETIVHSHGGYVDKYIGDCIMALFGAPKAVEDAPKRAVNAAIEIRSRLRELGRDPQCAVPLGVHIGINSGLVIAGEVGGPTKRDFTVVGDTVNVASRLKDTAPNGSIYVGAETHRYTRDAFQYQPLRPIPVKGKDEAITAFELLSAREQIHRPKPGRADRMITSDIVGRDREVQEITKAISNVITGNGGIVNLVGEAGIGKSRLMAEVKALDQIKHATVLEGRSLSIGQSLSFHPFVDLLRHWAGITEEDGAEDRAVAKLEAAVRELFTDEADEVFPFVATLMGMRVTGAHAERIRGIEGEALEKVILKSMRDLFRKMAEAKPLVLVFEDLHWADLSSMNLLEPLLRLVENSQVLFINVFRPQPDEASDRISRLCQDNYPDHHTTIRLERLTDKECDLLIQNLLKTADLPYTTRALIWQKAEGNPFFIEEVIRSLIDDGAVESADGRFRVTEKIHTVVIPATINDVIMSRVDRLDEATRKLLQEVFEVRFNRARAQMTSDPQRYFFDTIGSLRRLNQTDAAAIDEACGMFAGGAALFAWSGFSFDVGRRFLDIAQKLVRPENPRDMFVYRSMRFIHHYLEGTWGEEHAIPEDLVAQGLRYGQLWDVTAYLGFCCSIRTQQGDFETARRVIDRIAEINDEFAYHDFGKSHVYSQTAILLLEQRRLEEALGAIEVYYESRHEQVLNVLALGMKAKTHLLLGNLESAESALAQAEQVVHRAGRVPPWHLSDYVVSRFLFDLVTLEDCIRRGDRSALKTLRKRARRSGKEAVRIAAKVAKPRTEVLKLTGRLCWLLGEQEKALVCWTKSIEEGKELGVRPDLARTYMEIAARISESGSKHSELGGMDARGYLRSARELFSEIGLEWDLERVGALERRAA